MIDTLYVHENQTDRGPDRLAFCPDDEVLARAANGEARLAAIARHLRDATNKPGTRRTAQNGRVPGIAIGELNVVFDDPHGARLELASDTLIRESGVGSVDVGDPPFLDLGAVATSSVWEAFAAGADVVRIDSGPAAGTATLFRFLAAEARDHGFSDGVLFVTDMRGPAGDVAQRLATQIYPDQPPRYYSREQLGLLGRGRTFLVCVLRSRLTAADVAELCGIFPELRFVIDGAIDLAPAPTVQLGALTASAAERLFDERVRARDGAHDRNAVRGLCASVGSLPASVELVGVAAREVPSTFEACLAEGRGDDLVRAFIESRSLVERRILGVLAFAAAPLSNCHLCCILGARNIESELQHLVENALVRVCGPDTYELSRYVELRVSPLPDAQNLCALLAHIFSDILDRWSQAAVLDRQIAGAELFLERVDGDTFDDVVLEVGPLLARMYAIRGGFGGWGRVLRTIERAAMRAGDTDALALARHDLGVQALLAGQDSDAYAYLHAAVADRQRNGDTDGARASSAVLLLLDGQIARDEHVQPQPQSPAGRSPFERLTRFLKWPEETPFGHWLPIAVLERDVISLERWFAQFPAVWLIAAALCFVVAVLLPAGWMVASFLRPASDPVLEIVKFSAHPRAISAGRSATLCVDARDVAVVEIFPTATHFWGSGNHCLSVSPRFTTTYVAVGSAVDGRQVRAEMVVSVRGSSTYAAGGTAQRVSIADFSAHPPRIRSEQPTRLCYSVTGAHFLRVVPAIGKLVRLRSCETVTLRVPGRYDYTLSAIGDRGQVAVGHLHVDVVAAASLRASSAR
jgi:hypothetical protein